MQAPHTNRSSSSSITDSEARAFGVAFVLQILVYIWRIILLVWFTVVGIPFLLESFRILVSPFNAVL